MHRLVAFVLPALAACRVLDEEHCANLAGDATCRERGAGLDYCDRCVAARDGCVASPPADPGCTVETSGEGTSDPTSPTATVGETSAAMDATTTTAVGDPSTSSAETTDMGSTSLESTTDIGSTSLDTTTDATATGASSDETTEGSSCLGLGSVCRAAAECCSETCSALGLCI